MLIQSRPLRGWTLVIALALLLTACDATEAILGEEQASATEAATPFAEAWADQDYEGMASFLGPTSQDKWTPERLERAFATALSPAEMSIASVSLEPTYEDEPDDSAPFELSVTYDTETLDDDVVLSGPLEMVYSEEDEAWQVEWERDLLWPSVEGGKAFGLVTRFSKRAPLLDRKGRKLAIGPASERRYPYGSAAGTTIGHIEPVMKKDIPEGAPLEPGDLVGGSGLEEAFDERLSGAPWINLVVLNGKGKVIETVGRQSGTEGKPVKTTLDIRIQQAAEAGYGSTTGGAVVLDPKTGDILAAVASSPFNPANYVGVPGIEPFNRALSGLYPAGSSMKVMTAATALEIGAFKPDSKLTGPAEYKGVRNFESGAFGTLSFASALQNSVNTAFAQIAEKIGPTRSKRYADMFGFNRSPSMPLQAARSSFPFPEDEGDLMWGAIGQAQTLATPLQMATVAATIANGGKRMEPRIDMSIRPEGERVVSRKTARIMTELMESVVQGGTGVGAQISGVRVAGKTGTAEVDVAGERKNHAWFICFAPAGDPEVVVAVVSEYGGVGGQVAAPLARAILTRVLPLV